MSSKIKIYPIQTLRGFSVILVFLYHIEKDLFLNGYLGVDIFFLISGFIITHSIYSNDLKKFNLLSFLNKRIIRLFPLLFIIFSFSFTLYLLFGFVFQGSGASRLFISSLFGLSNFYLIFDENNYFENDFTNPFYHSWSLSVEIQFYILFGIIIFLINFLKIKNLLSFNKFVIILTLATVLFSFFNKFSDIFNFYSIFTRFWEFSLGSLAYLINIKLLNKKKIYSTIFFFYYFF